MQDFVPFQFTADLLGEYSLPQIEYPVPADFVPKLNRTPDGEMPFDMMLYWLQMQSGTAGVDWMDLESAMQRLVQLLTEDTSSQSVQLESEASSMEFTRVELEQEIVTLERDGYLLAALRPDEDKKLVIATYRPLDAQSLRLLLQLSIRPHPRHGVAMRPNNWEYVLDNAVAMDNFYAAERDEPCLSHFRFGIGGDEAQAVPPAQSATQVEVFSRFEGM